VTAGIKYDEAYFYNMLRMYSPTAKQICEARWNFVKEANARTVLDYGSGCGFFKAFAPAGVEVDTYDIMPVPITGIRRSEYDLVCFWDVLEHIPDFAELANIILSANYIAVTVPIKPENLPWEDYKHYKPFEHIHHFTQQSIKALLSKFGFDCIKEGTPECPPREMIHSFLFGLKK
jgi:hypothetical protein